MSKIQWEYDLVERPFCGQLKAMGWQWIEGDRAAAEFNENAHICETFFNGAFTRASQNLNLLARDIRLSSSLEVSA